MICEPKTTVEGIKEKYTNKTITVKKADGTVVNAGDVGTGYTITIGDKKYTTVKMGDVDGDGIIDTLDSLKALKQFVGTEKLSGVYKEAADINKDGTIDTLDSLKMLKNYATGEQININ